MYACERVSLEHSRPSPLSPLLARVGNVAAANFHRPPTLLSRASAYEYGVEALRQQGVPVDGLRFDSSLVIRGLIVDKELGNLVKVDRFGCGGVF